MRKLAAVLLCFALAASTAYAEIYWQPTTGASRLMDPSEAPVGWVALTEEQAAPLFVRDGSNYLVRSGIARRYLKSVDDLPVEMSAGEKAAVNLARTRSAARGNMLDAVSNHLALTDVRARMDSAGKDLTNVDAALAALDARITAALADLP